MCLLLLDCKQILNSVLGCSHLWCRPLELGEVSPTAFVTSSTRQLFLEDGYCIPSTGCSEDLPFPWARSRYTLICFICLLSTHSLLLEGSSPGRVPSHQRGLQKCLLFPAEMHLLTMGKAFLHAAGSGQVSSTQHMVLDQCGRRSSFPKRGTATTVMVFLGQQVWKPIRSAGIFTRLENKPE